MIDLKAPQETDKRCWMRTREVLTPVAETAGRMVEGSVGVRREGGRGRNGWKAVVTGIIRKRER